MKTVKRVAVFFSLFLVAGAHAEEQQPARIAETQPARISEHDPTTQLPGSEVHNAYYDDDSFTGPVVGQMVRMCAAGPTGYSGRVTSYFIQTQYPCSGPRTPTTYYCVDGYCTNF